MAPTRPLLLLLVLSAVAAAATGARAAIGGHREPMVGGWSPIENLTDPQIQGLARWAVERHAALASDGLRFSRVTRGEEQVVSGMNYRFCVDVADRAGKRATYVAVIYDQPWTKTRTLTSFTPAAKAAEEPGN